MGREGEREREGENYRGGGPRRAKEQHDGWRWTSVEGNSDGYFSVGKSVINYALFL